MDEPQKTLNEHSSSAPVMQDVKPTEPKTVPAVSAEVQESMSPATESDAVVAAPAMSELPKEPVSPPTEDTSQPLPSVTPDPAPAASPVKKSGNTKVVIALVVATILIVAAVVFYLGSNSDQTAQTSENTAPAQTTNQVAPATATDVDQAVTDVDDALTAADAAQDVTSDDLTDSALGL